MTRFPEVRLDQVAEVRLGRQRAPKNHQGEHMRPYLRAANVGWSGLQLDDVNHMNFTDAELATYRLHPGDLLLNEASGSPREVGKPALWSGEIEDCAFQNTLLRVRAHEHEPKFLLHYFRYVALSGRFMPEARGVGINHLGRARLAGWMTPLPGGAEQRRIVEMVEEHLSHLDAAVGYLSADLSRADVLRPRAFQVGMAGVECTEVDLLEVAHIANGQTPKGLADRLTHEGGQGLVPFYKVGDMNLGDGRWMDQSRHYVTLGAAESLRLHVRPAGTVLIPKRGGAIATNKKRILSGEAAYDLNTMGFQPKDELLPEFLWHWLETIDLGQLADGSNVPQINAHQIRGLRLPVPDLKTQDYVIQAANRVVDGAHRLQLAVAAALQRGEALRRAVLAAAFEGKLTGRLTDSEVIEELAEA